MISKTRISRGFQTVVPADVRKKFQVGPGDLLEWEVTDDGVQVHFRKKLSLRDITGIGDEEPSNAVKLKKKAQRGGKG